MHRPIRMCIICRQRYGQGELLRLQCLNKTLTSFTGRGRSFYLCPTCQGRKPQDLAKKIAHICKVEKDEALRMVQTLQGVSC